MRSGNKRRILLTIMGVLSWMPRLALAGDEKRQEAVLDRQGDIYEPQGVRTGLFLLYPKVDVKETGKSNIYATSSNRVSDWITTISPSLFFRSDMSRNALNLKLGADVNRYLNHGDENFTDFELGADGRIDVTRDGKITGGGSFKKQHEDRGSPDSSTADKQQIEYDVLNGFLGASHQLNRVVMKLDGSVDQYSYHDSVHVDGTTVSNGDRDRNEFNESLRVGYEFQSWYQVFVQGGMNQKNYRERPSLLFRDSKGYDAVVGTALDISGLINGDLYVGYMGQKYSDNRLTDTSGYKAGSTLRWLPTRLTAVLTSFSRTIKETTDVQCSGYVSTHYGVSVDHEFLRNMIFSGRIGMTRNDYQPAAAYTDFVSRKDDIANDGLGVKYKLNGNYWLSVDYDLTNRSSNIAGSDYRNHQIMVKLTSQM